MLHDACQIPSSEDILSTQNLVFHGLQDPVDQSLMHYIHIDNSFIENLIDTLSPVYGDRLNEIKKTYFKTRKQITDYNFLVSQLSFGFNGVFETYTEKFGEELSSKDIIYIAPIMDANKKLLMILFHDLQKNMDSQPDEIVQLKRKIIMSYAFNNLSDILFKEIISKEIFILFTEERIQDLKHSKNEPFSLPSTTFEQRNLIQNLLHEGIIENCSDEKFKLTQNAFIYFYKHFNELTPHKIACFFKRLQQNCESWIMHINNEIDIPDTNSPTKTSLTTTYDFLNMLHQLWVITMMTRNALNEVVYDENGRIIYHIKQKYLKKTLPKNPLHFGFIIKQLLGIDDEKFALLINNYNLFFSHITDPSQKNELLDALFKILDKNDFSIRFLDPKIFEGKSFEECKQRLALFNSAKEDPSIDLALMTAAAKNFIDQGKNPFLSFLVARFTRSNDMASQRKLLSFFETLDKHNTDGSFETYERAYRSWSKISPAKRSFLSLFLAYDIPVIEYLGRKDPSTNRDIISDAYIPFLKKYLDLFEDIIGDVISSKDLLSFLSSLDNIEKFSQSIENDKQSDMAKELAEFIEKHPSMHEHKISLFYSLLKYVKNISRFNEFLSEDTALFLKRINAHDEFNALDLEKRGHVVFMANELFQFDALLQNATIHNADKFIFLMKVYRMTKAASNCVSAEEMISLVEFFTNTAINTIDNITLIEGVFQYIADFGAMAKEGKFEDEQSIDFVQIKDVIAFLQSQDFSASAICEILNSHLKHQMKFEKTIEHLKATKQINLPKDDEKTLVASIIGKVKEERFDILLSRTVVWGPILNKSFSFFVEIAANAPEEEWLTFLKYPLNR
jgi:hypothetical protein